VRPYLAGLASGAARTVRAPGELLVRLSFLLIILVVMASLWRAAVAAHGGSLAGYSAGALIWYVCGAQVAVIGAPPRTVEAVGDEIGSGEVAVAMLRPVSVLGLRLAVEIGAALVRLACAAVLGGGLGLLVGGRPPDLRALPLLLLAVPLGCAANLAGQHAFGGIAFWLLDAKAAWFLYQKLVFLLGGLLLPLEILPGPMAAVARLLPWAAMAYVPGRIASGHLDPALIGAQLGWLAALIGVGLMVFAAGERRLQLDG
jgi:ABC-2 type transport system permease protein